MVAEELFRRKGGVHADLFGAPLGRLTYQPKVGLEADAPRRHD
jgi:hypothetical protein